MQRRVRTEEFIENAKLGRGSRQWVRTLWLGLLIVVGSFTVSLNAPAQAPAAPSVAKTYPFPGGRVAVIWHEAIYGHTLDIFKEEKLAHRYEASPSGAIFHSEHSQLLQTSGGKGLYFVAIWNNGVRSQTIVVHDLKQDGQIVLEQHSLEEVLYQVKEDVITVSYVVAQHREQGPPLKRVRERRLSLK